MNFKIIKFIIVKLIFYKTFVYILKVVNYVMNLLETQKKNLSFLNIKKSLYFLLLEIKNKFNFLIILLNIYVNIIRIIYKIF